MILGAFQALWMIGKLIAITTFGWVKYWLRLGPRPTDIN